MLLVRTLSRNVKSNYYSILTSINMKKWHHTKDVHVLILAKTYKIY